MVRHVLATSCLLCNFLSQITQELHQSVVPFIHCFAQVVGDGDEQHVLRLWAQVVDGFKQVFRVHTESVTLRCRLKNLAPPGGDPTVPPPPHLPGWDPQIGMNSNPLERWGLQADWARSRDTAEVPGVVPT